jgi:hypothetical protein
MPTFSSGREAKEYIIALVDEADRDGTPLSETERKMMYFSETAWTLPDMWEVSEVFERDYDQPTYEAKIGGLARKAWGHAIDAEEDEPWKDAVSVLRGEDHYLLVLLDANKQSTRSLLIDRVKLVLTALLVISLLFVGIFLFSQKR